MSLGRKLLVRLEEDENTLDRSKENNRTDSGREMLAIDVAFKPLKIVDDRRARIQTRIPQERSVRKETMRRELMVTSNYFIHQKRRPTGHCSSMSKSM